MTTTKFLLRSMLAFAVVSTASALPASETPKMGCQTAYACVMGCNVNWNQACSANGGGPDCIGVACSDYQFHCMFYSTHQITCGDAT